ncbi:MAG: BamA/TamA family outer membrane protein, partial [Bacteroidota bacterium]|nr:BamA/TamA family outer membrane protein [Bacteroidota bacterium]
MFLSFILSIFLNNLVNSGISTLTPNDTPKVIINNIILIGNKRTKNNIIHRELTFKVGDIIKKNDLPEILKISRQNLLNASLFNFVTIDYAMEDSTKADIIINMTERWYIWPFPVFEFADRNFNAWLETKKYSRLNYGLYLQDDNFRGRRESIQLLLQFGYDESFKLLYTIPYIDNKKKFGIYTEAGVLQNHEIAYATQNNKLKYIKDIDDYAKQNVYGKIGITYRNKINFTHSLDISYNYFRIDDTVKTLNPNYFYSNNNNNKFIALNYLFKIDFRDSKSYPLNGYYIDLIATKNGLGILRDEKLDMLLLETNIREYLKINKNFFFGSGLTARYVNNPSLPFLMQKALGYDRDFIRGYEYYVIDGQHFGTLKTNIKYELVSERKEKVNIVKAEKFNTFHYAFYLNAFSDIGYVSATNIDTTNTYVNKCLVGYGIGLDYVTYYDK